MKKLTLAGLALTFCALAAFAAVLLDSSPAEAATVRMVCEGQLCEAWVVGGGGSTYLWSGSGGAVPAQQGTGPSMLYNCSPSASNGLAHVNVYASNGSFLGSTSRRVCDGGF